MASVRPSEVEVEQRAGDRSQQEESSAGGSFGEPRRERIRHRPARDTLSKPALLQSGAEGVSLIKTRGRSPSQSQTESVFVFQGPSDVAIKCPNFDDPSVYRTCNISAPFMKSNAQVRPEPVQIHHASEYY